MPIDPVKLEAMSRAESLDEMPWANSPKALQIRTSVEDYDAAQAGLAMRPYQEAACVNLLVRKHVLLADEMGLGKTPESICAAHILGLKRVLIITPKSVALGWQQEIKKWCGRDADVWLTKKKNNAINPAGQEQWLVVPWSQVTPNLDKIIQTENDWDLVIVDESHFAKNPTAQRTQAVFGHWKRSRGNWMRVQGLVDHTERMWCLTGTPIKNKPIDLYPSLHALQAGAFAKSQDTFGQRYCKFTNRFTPRGYDYTGAINLPELNIKLRQSVMVRRLKKDVQKDMPPKVREIVPIAPDAAINNILRRENKIVSMDDRLRMRDALGKGSVPDFTECSEVRHEMGLAKIPRVLDYLKDTIATDPAPLVVCAYHRDVIEDVTAGLVKAGIAAHCIHGGHSAVQRQGIIDRFVAGEIQILVVSIPACGTGVNGLQKVCQHAIMIELDWAQSAMWQMEDRLHRFGQEGSVLITYLMVPDSLDPYMLDTILSKSAIEQEILE